MFDPKLLLPEVIYALPGFEINIYFQNIVTVINPANYAFDVECEKGRCDQLRWRWIPEEEDAGKHKLKLYTFQALLREKKKFFRLTAPFSGSGRGNVLCISEKINYKIIVLHLTSKKQ